MTPRGCPCASASGTPSPATGTSPRALEQYQRQLSLAQALGVPERDLAVIHVSLATTFRDLRDHSRAVLHYHRELELHRGDPLEECRTWLNVALALSEGGRGPAEVVPPLTTALQRARAAGDPKLQRRILRLLHAQQLRGGDPEGASETLTLLRELGGHEGDEEEEEEEEEPETQEEEEEEESELELSESEGEDEELEGYPKSVPGRRRSNKWNRRNERGETPLHRACIEGHPHRVRLLLQQVGTPKNTP
ncbi:tonsoku-like protein [Pseudopipra pipra]|uniref:tonsoku-like protein n=1 Tax=Pseudopipra pipra TaxID=415032 RepID=UPI0031399F0D